MRKLMRFAASSPTLRPPSVDSRIPARCVDILDNLDDRLNFGLASMRFITTIMSAPPPQLLQKIPGATHYRLAMRSNGAQTIVNPGTLQDVLLDRNIVPAAEISTAIGNNMGTHLPANARPLRHH